MTFKQLNELDMDSAQTELERCCGAHNWVIAMEQSRPFTTREALFERAESLFETLSESDWLEAFQHHPKIGDLDALRQKFASTAGWASGEQAGTSLADETTLELLAQGNSDYEEKFGFIFIICATGKSAAEMLEALLARIGNAPETELRNAAGEQRKITRLRLEKLLS